jgi:hypothetical protein
MTTNTNNQNKTAEQSCKSLGEMFDEISPNITDGEYLQLMNNLKIIIDHLTNGQARVGTNQKNINPNRTRFSSCRNKKT